VRAVQVSFSYFNDDPKNVRNMADIGAAASTTSAAIASSPAAVLRRRAGAGGFDHRPRSQVRDRPPGECAGEVSGNRQLSFMVSTQLVPYQRVEVFGTTAGSRSRSRSMRPGYPCRIFKDTGKDLKGGSIETIAVEPATVHLAAEAFSKAIRKEMAWPFPITDAVQQMRIIDAVYKSGESGKWEAV